MAKTKLLRSDEKREEYCEIEKKNRRIGMKTILKDLDDIAPTFSITTIIGRTAVPWRIVWCASYARRRRTVNYWTNCFTI